MFIWLPLLPKLGRENWVKIKQLRIFWYFLNSITVSGTDLYKEHIYRVRDLLCYILELKFGFCMHLKNVTLNIVHETRMSLTNDLLPDISHGNNTCIWNGRLNETFYSKRFVYPNAFFWNGENIWNGTWVFILKDN